MSIFPPHLKVKVLLPAIMAHFWSDKDIAPSCFTFLQQKIFCPFPVNLQNVGFIRKTLYLSRSSSEEGIDDQGGGQEGEEGQVGGGEGQGGGVQETLVPQLHLQWGGVWNRIYFRKMITKGGSVPH